MERASLHTIVRGLVQGVYFRSFVRRHASSLGLCGYVRNLPSGWEVEVYAEGEKDKLEALLEKLRIGPPGSKVEEIEIKWGEYSGGFKDFVIRY